MSTRARAVPGSGAARMRRALALAGCSVLSVGLSACESTEQESAKLNREGQQLASSQGGLKLGAVNHSVHASDVTLLSSGGRTAVAVKLHASSTQAEVPLLVTVTGVANKVLYTNSAAGTEPSLQQMASLRAGQDSWWVDDQVLTSQTATHARVRVGTGKKVKSSAVPQIAISAVRLGQASGQPTLSGKLVNHSATSQAKLPVFAVALRGGKIVAAGRAVIESLPAHSSAPVAFQIFLVGNPAGATTKLTVAPSVG